MTTLTPSKHILTSMISSLNTISVPKTTPSTTVAGTTTPQLHASHSSILQNLAPADQLTAKNTLLTLHFLFPHELLPALDLIDRRLIIHLHIATAEVVAGSTEQTKLPTIEVYYVQSASSTTTNSSTTGPVTMTSKRGRFRNALSKPGMIYEVRPDAWNCSCPAFGFSSLKLMMLRDRAANDNNGNVPAEFQGVAGLDVRDYDDDGHGVRDWLFGGIATGSDATIPICKHILAVVLAKAAPALFGGGVVSREVDKDELAGWAAGWGEH